MPRIKKGNMRKAKKERRGIDKRPKGKLRIITQEGEEYAKITRIYGAENAEVMCNDGVLRQCVIRKKFRGRRKKSNTLKVGGFVLVGLRTWEIINPKKKPKCDLLYVYGKLEGEGLKPHLKAPLLGTAQEKEEDVVFNNEVDVDDI